MIEASASSPPASYPLTGKTCTAFMTNCTSSPSLRSRSSTDSVVSTEAICAGAETSNLTRDITSSVFIEVTRALIWFLAPYCGISFVAPFALGISTTDALYPERRVLNITERSSGTTKKGRSPQRPTHGAPAQLSSERHCPYRPAHKNLRHFSYPTRAACRARSCIVSLALALTAERSRILRLGVSGSFG